MTIGSGTREPAGVLMTTDRDGACQPTGMIGRGGKAMYQRRHALRDFALNQMVRSIKYAREITYSCDTLN